PEDPGPKIAVAGGDSPSPPRDSRFFGQGHMIDKADVNSEKESNKANNDEKTSNVANMDNVSTLPAPTSALASASHSPAPGSDIVACPVLAFSESCQYPDLRDGFDLHPKDCAVRSFHSQDPPKYSSGRGAPRKRVVHRDDPVPSREQLQGSGVFDPVQRDGNTVLDTLNTTRGPGDASHVACTAHTDDFDDADHLTHHPSTPDPSGFKDGQEPHDNVTN
ncbi:hypothetical protein KEM54_006820, partial [Ascosphaera aggregata]